MDINVPQGERKYQLFLTIAPDAYEDGSLNGYELQPGRTALMLQHQDGAVKSYPGEWEIWTRTDTEGRLWIVLVEVSGVYTDHNATMAEVRSMLEQHGISTPTE